VVRLELGAVSSHAFWKYGNVFSTCQRLHDGAIGTPCIVALLALDEDGAGPFHQEADYRPAAYIRLRDETYANHRVDHPDVQP